MEQTTFSVTQEMRQEAAFRKLEDMLHFELQSSNFIRDHKFKTTVKENKISIILLDEKDREMAGSGVYIMRHKNDCGECSIQLEVHPENYTDLARLFKYKVINRILNDFNEAYDILHGTFIAYEQMKRQMNLEK